MNRKLYLAILSFVIGLFLVVIIFRDKREYTCLTPDEIEALKRYQAITDIVCPMGEWEDDYSWVQ